MNTGMARRVNQALLAQGYPAARLTNSKPFRQPVTVVEYASVTCPHCALWQKNTWPAFKAKYVDTNKVRYVFRELPTGPVNVAVAGFMIARCAGEDKYFDVVHNIMASQGEWRVGARPRLAL